MGEYASNYNDRSGSITTAGQSQLVMNANPERRYILIQNPPSATEPLFINFTNAASASDGKSLEIAPGGTFSPRVVTQEAIYATAATVGHSFTAREA